MTKLYTKLTWLLFGLMMNGQIMAQTCIRPSASVTKTSFAIFTDEQTYQSCNKVINEYRQTLENEGLPTFIFYKNWNNPEEVKTEIRKLFETEKLEGVVFIGDIPIPMIRKAQHLTSAFKMDEHSNIFESSVPSDRFYDDLHLKFDFIKCDSVKPWFFYYNLAADSPQEIRCNIYSGRIKPLKNGTDKYDQIRSYLAKAIKEHHADNHLNQLVSYTGEGSYSNSLLSWASEMNNLHEQFPGVFDSAGGNARLLRFSFSDFPKEEIMNQLKRKDLDLMIFHEHGMPNRQYLSGIADTYEMGRHIEEMKASLRSSMQYYLSGKGKKSTADFYAKNTEKYGLDSTLVSGYKDPNIEAEDSLTDLRRGLLLDDITRIQPNTRFVIFDACFNGDFREDDYIAGRYIFSGGNCIAAYANTVNVLQDKQADELLGLLGLGARIGQWARFTNILESHIIGDPTFRFTSSDSKWSADKLISTPYSDKELTSFTTAVYPCDIQELALHLLYYRHYKDLSPLLFHKFKTSPNAMVRYTCFSLLEHLDDKNFNEVLKIAVNDPYEFLRRIAVNRMGRVGLPEYLPYLIDAYLNDRLAERVTFNVITALRSFDKDVVKKVVEERVSHSYVLDKEAAIKELTLNSIWSLAEEMNEDVLKRTLKESRRIFGITTLKNINIHPSIEKYLVLVQDPSESVTVRLNMLQSLAWFDLSYKKELILKACEHMMKDNTLDKSLQEEALRTYNRLNKGL